MNIELLQKIIDLISDENTKSPTELASRLNVSERMVYKYISFLKTEFEAPVKYCFIKKSYYFSENGKLDLRWHEVN